MSVWHFEVRIQLQHLVLLHVFRHVLVQGEVVQFWRDWIVAISGLVWSLFLGPLLESEHVFIFGDVTTTAAGHPQDARHTLVHEVPTMVETRVPTAMPSKVHFWQRAR